MTTGRDVFNGCCQFIGEPYSTNAGRTDPNSGYKDCSGLMAAGYEVATGFELGQYVSVTIFDMCAKAGLEIPFQDALSIVGAVLLRPEDPYQGWGSAGHIAMSDGAGGTVEATPPRVQRLSVYYNWPWSSRACLLPGIDYSNNGEGGAQPKKKGIPKMWIAFNIEAGHPGYLQAVQVSGEILGDKWGPGPVTNNPFGIPDPAVKFHQDHEAVEILPVSGAFWDRLHMATFWSQVDPRSVVQSGEQVTVVQDLSKFTNEEVVADVVRRMND